MIHYLGILHYMIKQYLLSSCLSRFICPQDNSEIMDEFSLKNREKVGVGQKKRSISFLEVIGIGVKSLIQVFLSLTL